MSTWKLPLLLLGLSLLAVSATGRPCNTIFFFTSTSYYPIPASTHPSNSNRNPNFSLQYTPLNSPRFLTFFFTTSNPFNGDSKARFNKFLGDRNAVFVDRIGGEEEENQLVEREEEDVSKPMEFYSAVKSSIRDRSKDIMRVMGAMLFGAGCGALTAAMMYLIRSLFWPTAFDFEEDSDDDDFDDDVSPKKLGGYVILPTKVVDDDLKKPAKEVV
uniref:Uncharacterized protein n=1 Tax=Nicotiana tabacum TaxID=4097 RepID=A0A1S4ADX9_TOBAC|nr:PREDICTED: uncharacterized protein LOC107796604 [Nicotiana tabacum]